MLLIELTQELANGRLKAYKQADAHEVVVPPKLLGRIMSAEQSQAVRGDREYHDDDGRDKGEKLLLTHHVRIVGRTAFLCCESVRHGEGCDECE